MLYFVVDFMRASFCFVLFAGIATEMSVWDGVVVSALDKAYERPPERTPEEDNDDMDADEDSMETVDQ